MIVSERFTVNILMITANDPAGMGIAFCKAINRYTDHSCRLITTEERYGFAYETDIHLPDLGPDGFDEVEQVLADADIIHFHMLSDENIRLGPLRVRDFMAGKKIVHHHHGHPHFRANPELYRDKYRKLGRKSLVSTPDLLKLLPGATWIPNLVDLDNPLLQPRTTPANGKIVIGQSPTRKDLKNTDDLIEVVVELKKKPQLPDIELRILELIPHKKCLDAKNDCHIIFDHMQGYYGVSSLESLSQGKPVIAGIDDWNRKHIVDFFKTDDLPWIIARDKTQLEERLILLTTDHGYREETGRYSRKFMEHYWNEETVIKKLTIIYESL